MARQPIKGQLEEKVAVEIGASRGIGRTTTQRLTRNRASAVVNLMNEQSFDNNNDKKELTVSDQKHSLHSDPGELNSVVAAIDDLQHPTIDQIAAAFGGPTREGQSWRLSYVGLSPTRDAAHAILIREFLAILDKFKIPDPARLEMMTVLANFESQIFDG